MKRNMLYFVGVGPGDPELVTLKAARIIGEANMIALPEGGAAARAAGDLISGKVIMPLRLPMTEEPEALKAAHAAAAEEIGAALEGGLTVAYLVLGDPSLYASCTYLMRRLEGLYPFEVVPGIPAMCAAAAALKMPLAVGRERLHVLPGYREGDVLPEDGAAVVMKAGKALDALKDACAGRMAACARNVGMEGERLGTLEDADAGRGDYFTTVIIRPA